MTLNKPLFLIGYMGSGKTTMGKLIAEELQLPFLDTDDVLAEQEGIACGEIIRTKGQEYFRLQEQHLLNHLPKDKGIIVATGGGMPCFLDNISLINNIGISLFLDWSVENLAIRLSLTDLSTRPMLLGKSGEELCEHIQKQLAERIHYYRQAQQTIACDGHTDEEIAHHIAQLFQ